MGRFLRKPLWLLGGVLSLLVAVGVGLVFLAPLLFGIQYIIVLSGSMTPAMPVGSVIGVGAVDPAQVAVGDIITHWHPNDREVLVTHRVVELTTSDDGALAFRTKGDANEEIDSYLVPAEHVWGRVLLFVPHVGYTRDFIKTLPGLALLVLLPAGLLLINEVMFYMRQPNPRRKALLRRRRRRASRGTY